MSTHRLERLPEETLKKLFTSIDIDGSGSISKGELIKGLRNHADLDDLMSLPHGGGRLADIEDLFQKFDKDHSGTISFDEFSDLVHQARVEAHRRSSIAADQDKGKGKGKDDKKEAKKAEKKKAEAEKKTPVAVPVEVVEATTTPSPSSSSNLKSFSSTSTEFSESQGEVVGEATSKLGSLSSNQVVEETSEFSLEHEEPAPVSTQSFADTTSATVVIDGDSVPQSLSSTAVGRIPLRQHHSIVINAPHAEVWRKLSHFGEAGAHFFKKETVTSFSLTSGSPYEIGARRHLVLSSGVWADERLVSLNERDFTLSFCVEDSSLPVWGFYSTWSLREITIPGSMTLFEAAIELLTTPEEYDEIDKIFHVLLQGNLETLKHNLEAGL